ncbi:HAD family hydrolase [Kiloniella majae]|uniref:HAD family hydrolase n=1 Tax=Kiloniella majae TaxID=1938558 RepID=UPI0015C4EB11|nr:HAD family phosphatase [Kiloniella majae]
MPFNADELHAVVFDMDGLLIDSEAIYLRASVDAAKELGFALSEELYKSVVGLTMQAGEDIIRKGMGNDFPFDEFNSKMHELLEIEFARHVPLKTGAEELLTLLAERNLPVAVATSTSRRRAESHLTHAGVIPYFSTIVTSGDVTRGKPDPEPYLLATKRLGVSPKSCLALEDSHNGVRSAHGAGLQTIMVPDMLAPTDEISVLCIAVMESLHKVREQFLT